MWVALVALLVAGVHFAGVFPTRTYLAQRASLATAKRNLEVLTGQNEVLEKRVALLQSDAEIERLARERYNLVRPGEEAYAVLPPTGATSTTTTTIAGAPAGPNDDPSREGNFLQRLWRRLTDRG